MPRTHIHRVHVEFGDCDPAGIAYFPNFFRWFDAASRHYFAAAGVPPWRELEKTDGILGTPVVDVSCRFVAPTSYGEDLEVHTSITEWGNKSFTMRHELRRGTELLAEGREVRVFVKRHPENPARMVAVPAPEQIKRMCG